VTRHELLSPSNKEPLGDRLYSRKRLELIHQAVHLVELDFLIGGKRLAMEDEFPTGRSIDYRAPLDLPLGAADRAWAEELARGCYPQATK
jgi:hypothetical protein